MSLLTIIQNALNETGGVLAPSSIVGNGDPTAVQCLALANEVVKEAARDIDWPRLSRTATITTVASQEEYALPSDFLSIVEETMWNTSQFPVTRS